MENKTHLKLKSGYITSPNIAIVKYWGKIDTESIIPLNTSLSFTLNPDDLSTTTKITLSSKYKENLFFLNDKPSILNKR
jgi:diphosphomevalonate decarboxylase